MRFFAAHLSLCCFLTRAKAGRRCSQEARYQLIKATSERLTFPAPRSAVYIKLFMFSQNQSSINNRLTNKTTPLSSVVSNHLFFYPTPSNLSYS
jgi:hypothetical protein